MIPSWLRETPFAHRGLHGPEDRVPENSRAAFRAALAAGYGIELDVQPSRDGVAMVFHDTRLERLCGSGGETGARTAAELSRLSLNGTTETIPALAEVLDLVAGQVPLLVELKSPDGRPADALEAEVAKLLQDYGGPAAVQSFAVATVAWFQRSRPDIPCGQIVDTPWKWEEATRDAIAEIIAGERPPPDFVAHEVNGLPSIFSRWAKSKSIPVLTWTVHNDIDAERARDFSDNVIFETWRPSA